MINKTDTEAFKLAFRYGHLKLAGILIQNYERFNIDLNVLNAKNQHDETPFHLACVYGWSEITEMLVQKSTEKNFDLNAKKNMMAKQLFIMLA